MNFKEFRETLKTYSDQTIIFIGLGNPLRSDDGAGLFFLEHLQDSAFFDQSQFIRAETNPENYLQKIIDSPCSTVVFIDAVKSDQSPGTIFWIPEDDLDGLQISTHAFSIKMIEKYLSGQREFGFHYLGIQPESTRFGEGMSYVVRDRIVNFFKKVKS